MTESLSKSVWPRVLLAFTPVGFVVACTEIFGIHRAEEDAPTTGDSTIDATNSGVDAGKDGEPDSDGMEDAIPPSDAAIEGAICLPLSAKELPLKSSSGASTGGTVCNPKALVDGGTGPVGLDKGDDPVGTVPGSGKLVTSCVVATFPAGSWKRAFVRASWVPQACDVGCNSDPSATDNCNDGHRAVVFVGTENPPSYTFAEFLSLAPTPSDFSVPITPSANAIAVCRGSVSKATADVAVWSVFGACE